MNISEQQERSAIEFAKCLAGDHVDPDEPVRDRLWQIATKLDVDRIEPRMTSSLGFLARLDSGKYAIYYSDAAGCAHVRRNFTVAHELAHLVLDRFVPHIDSLQSVAREEAYSKSNLERTVERIAAELLMPERLVVDQLKTRCKQERENSAVIPRLRIIRDICSRLNVSEQAMVFRLLELPQLSSVLIRIQCDDSAPRRKGTITQRRSQYVDVRIVDSLFSIKRNVENNGFDSMALSLKIQTPFGCRQLKCDGWKRPVWSRSGKHHEYWIVGWTWNGPAIPSFDDAD